MKSLINEQMKRFNLLSSEIEAAYHEAALKLGLSDSTMTILYTLYCQEGECLLNDIVLISGTSKQTINSALRKLETQDIIYLKSFEGRKKKVFLTDKGKQLANNTISQLITIENEIFDTWSDKERTLYVELTQRYLTAFKQKIKKLLI